MNFLRTGMETPKPDWHPNCFVYLEHADGKLELMPGMARMLDITGRVLVELKDGRRDWCGPYGVYADPEGKTQAHFRAGKPNAVD